ncbi:hypothetical protein G5I_10163 [Acromyrmex echinatior]|uniref:Uncharacterized protein n=1 Tax=Acromyrmex echinatior TaxID=103372 RepID=F4WW10_ACREC|nr:hypothetical protein G5I_10163 [Acromyrmex echinatior]
MTSLIIPTSSDNDAARGNDGAERLRLRRHIVTTWHKSVVSSSLNKNRCFFKTNLSGKETLTCRKLRPHFLDVVRIPIGNSSRNVLQQGESRVSAFPIALANIIKFGAVATDTSTSIVVRARPAEKPITPLSVYTGSRLYARPRNVFPLRPRMQRETRSYPRRSGRSAFGEKLPKKPRVADTPSVVKRDRISGRPVARMGAGGGIVVVIVDSSSGTTMDGWMVRLFASRRCLLDGGACATFTWLHNQGTFARASERGELGKWENHTILRCLHHHAVVERTSSNSIMTLVGMLKFNRVSILSPVYRRKLKLVVIGVNAGYQLAQFLNI